MIGRHGWLALAVLVAVGCRSDGATPPGEPSYSIAPRSGAFTSGPAGSRLLAIPLALVTDAAGDAASGVTVTLRLVSGDAAGFSLPEATIVTGPDGLARADVVLGAPGSAQVEATAAGRGDPTATAIVTATAAPTLTGIAPASFGTGDVVTLTGSGFTAAPGGTTALIGGIAATILDASSTSIRLRAPACVAPGEVPVTVTLGGTATNAVTATYVSSAAQASLQLLDGVTVPAERAAECLSLLGEGARYLVVPQYATSDDVSAAVRSSRPGFVLDAGGSAEPPVAARAEAAPATATVQERFDRALRLRERALAPAAAASGAHPLLDAPPLAALALNSTRDFKVLSDLAASDEFADVRARLKYIGANVLIYVDLTAPPGFTDAQLTALGNLFDGKLYPAAAAAFGGETDIDRNDHVVVLMTPVVNRLTTVAECEDAGFVTGFFYGLDLLPTRANSNKGEIFYSMVPDPSGATGSCDHPVAQVSQVVPSTFIHELQHMISFGQHVLVRGGADEELWLNEGLSHMAEEIGSLLYERDPTQQRTDAAQIFPDSAQGFINGNLRNAYNYLESSSSISVTQGIDGASLDERGAAWLFLRWLGDQKGDDIFRRLVETTETGVANIEDKTGEPFPRLFGDFSVALYAVEGLPEVTAAAVPTRYRFTSRDFRRIFRRLFDTETQDVDRPFPIETMSLDVDAMRAGSLVPGTMTWYELRVPAGTPRATIRMAPSTGAAFDEALDAQVTIFRLPPGA